MSACEKQPGCDSALGAISDETDVELHGETDDEDTEDGETGFDDGIAQVRTSVTQAKTLSKNTRST